MSKQVVVVGATGNVGHGIVERLLSRGVSVRAVGRSAERLARLVRRGAQPVVATLDDRRALERAFGGASAVFVMVPPDYQASDLLASQARQIENLAAALRATGAPHTVALASVGAEHAQGVGPVASAHRLEQALKAIPNLPLVSLRPAFFMENHFGALPVIRQHGVIGGTLTPDRPLSQVGVRDISAAAAELLERADFSGTRIQPLLGPADRSMQDVARVLGAAIGHPELPYVRMEDGALHGGLVASGFAPRTADLFIEMFHAIDAGSMKAARDAASTTPTTLEQFAADAFAPAYQALAAA